MLWLVPLEHPKLLAVPRGTANMAAKSTWLAQPETRGIHLPFPPHTPSPPPRKDLGPETMGNPLPFPLCSSPEKDLGPETRDQWSRVLPTTPC